MTTPSIITSLLWSTNSQKLAAQYQIPNAVLSAAQTPVNGAYNVSALMAYISGGGAPVGGYPVLGQGQPSATGWTVINGATIAYSTTPPAGCPLSTCMKVTPAAGGGGNNPWAFSPGIVPVYPGVNYQVSANLFTAATIGTVELTIGIDWLDGSGLNIVEEAVYAIPLPNFTAGVWNPISCPLFEAPQGAGSATTFAGLSGPTINVANVCSIAGLYLQTPYA